jgi:hypothetical protein
MTQPIAADNPLRRYLLIGALVLAVALLMAKLVVAGPVLTSLPLYDFVEYWAAARLTLQGDNPYDIDRMEQLQRATGRTDEGILMWNPPWTLPFVLPLGLLDVRTAHLGWLALHFAIIVFCSDRLWRLYGGPADHRWVAWVLALSFLPSYFALTAGQITPLILLGATLFLYHSERSSYALMGVAAVLLAIKPHLCYLFWIALLCWALRERRWKLLAAGAATGALLTLIPLALDPALLQQYWFTLTSQPPAQYRSPTLAHCLRVLIDPGNFRLQFLAMLPGIVWFVPWFYCNRHRWVWKEQLPLLLLVSVLTTAYGGWPFDLVLLLVPVVQVAARLQPKWRATAIGAHIAIGLVAVVQLAFGIEYFWFIWMCPALVGAYLMLQRCFAKPQTPEMASSCLSSSPGLQ